MLALLAFIGLKWLSIKRTTRALWKPETFCDVRILLRRTSPDMAHFTNSLRCGDHVR